MTPTSFAAAFTGQLPFRVFHRWRLRRLKTLALVFSAAGVHSFAVLGNPRLVAKRHFDQAWDDYEVFDGPDDELLERTLDKRRQISVTRLDQKLIVTCRPEPAEEL